MAAEGGYSAASQFQQIGQSAATAAVSVHRMAADFAAISAASYGLANAINAFGQLEQTLRLTNSVAQGTQKELKEMDTAVRNMALGFKYTASEGASALYFLASAGFSVKESLSAMNAVVLLSQGTLNTLENTSDTLASTLQSFALGADQAMRVANLFAASISTTQASMEKLSYSMRYVGPVAHSMGASIEETVVALSALYNAGNRGQQGGTLLRNILVRIINPTRESSEIFARLGVAITEADGRVRNFVDVLKELQGLNLSPITLAQLFEQRGVSGVQTLLKAFDPAELKRRMYDATGALTEFGQQVENIAKKANKPVEELRTEWDYLTAAMTNTNFASRLALDQVTTLAGSFGRAKNAVNELFISVGEQLAPGFTALANSITSMVRAFRGLDDAQKSNIVNMGLLAIAVYGLVKALQGIANSAASGGTFSLRNMAEHWNTIRLSTDRAAAAQIRYNAAVAAGAAIGTVPSATSVTGWRNAAGYQVAQPTPSAANLRQSAAAAGASGIGAAASFAAVTGIVGSVVTAILTVGAIGLAVVAAWPLISSFFEKQLPGKSAIAKQDMRELTATQVQSIESSTGTLFEKHGMYEGVLESLAEKQKTLNELLMAQGNIALVAQRHLQEYYSTLARGNEMPELAAEISSDTNFDPNTFQAKGDRAKFQWLRLLKIADPAEIRRLKADFNNAVKSQQDALDTLETFDKAQKDVRDKMVAIIGTDEYAAQKLVQDLAGGSLADKVGTTVLLDAWLKAIEKDSREAVIKARQLEAQLRSNPLEQFAVEVQTAQLNAINQLTSSAETIQRGFQENLSKFTAASKGSTQAMRIMLTQVDRMISGQDWRQVIDETDRSKDVLVKGALKTFIEGGTQQQVMDALQAAIDEISLRTTNIAPEVRGQILRTAQATKAMWEGILRQYYAIAAQQAMLVFERQRDNRNFVQTLRQAFVDFQTQVFQDVFSGSGDTAYSAKLQIDMSGLRKRFNDQVKQINDLTYDFIKRSGFAGANEGERSRILNEANRLGQQLTKAATDAYDSSARLAIQNIINAQQRIIGELRVARAQALTTRSQIASETQLLLDMLGLPIPEGTRREASLLGVREVSAQSIAKIEQMKEELRKFDQQLESIERAKLLRGGELKIADIPLEMIGDAAEKMNIAIRQAMDTGTKEFATTFNTQTQTWNEQIKGIFENVLDGFRSVFGQSKPVQSTAPTTPGATPRVPGSALPEELPGVDYIKTNLERIAQGHEAIAEAARRRADAQQAATSPVVAQNEDRIAAAIAANRAEVTKNIEAQEALRRTYEQRYGTMLTALQIYDQETKAIQQLGKEITVVDSLWKGLEYQQRKMVQEYGTSAKFIAQAYETGVTSIANNLTAFLSGQQKDWRKMIQAILNDLAQLFIRAALMRSLLGIGGFFGLGGGGGGIAEAAKVGAASLPTRMHSGTGSMSPDEKMAVIRNNERVYRPEDLPRASVVVNIHPAVSGEVFDTQQNADGSIDLIGRIIDQKLTSYDKRLPDRVASINRDPRRRHA